VSSTKAPATAPDVEADGTPIRRVLVGISGSISAMELPQSILWLRHQRGLEVRAIMTRQATTMVSPRAVAVASGNPVLLDEGDGPHNDPAVAHISLTRWADLFLVVPASGNVLGKAANGIADDVLSTFILAADSPVVFAPSMNQQMWRKPAVQRNVALLRADGHGVVEPIQGRALADGGSSSALMPEIDAVFEWATRFAHEAAAAKQLSGALGAATNGLLVEATAS
jgi:phosphopantothenoylcysteine synthetase/decarboxylase